MKLLFISPYCQKMLKYLSKNIGVEFTGFKKFKALSGFFLSLKPSHNCFWHQKKSFFLDLMLYLTLFFSKFLIVGPLPGREQGVDINVLFITRKFPPTKGGMQKVACELYKHLSGITNVELIKWAGSNKWLPLVLPYFFLKSCWILLRNKIDIIYLQDGLLSSLGLLLKKISGKKVVTTIHGLDVTYNNKFYQILIPKCVSKLDKAICISQATKQECINRGIPEEKIIVIPNGISDGFYLNEDKEVLKSALEKMADLKIKDKKVLLSVGRLVERKGIHWFVENVIPKLLKQRNDFVYLIAGDGIFKEKIEEVIHKNNLEDYVIILGRVGDEVLKSLYNSSEVFVMPNIHVEGDMEGFGIVALEAASCGLPVVASKLEGVKDAVKDGKNGFLVEAYNIKGFVKAVNGLLENEEKREEFGRHAREFSLERYSWNRIACVHSKNFLRLVKNDYEN
jgi:glycosyltransferase involved in cell wall biosynthesis